MFFNPILSQTWLILTSFQQKKCHFFKLWHLQKNIFNWFFTFEYFYLLKVVNYSATNNLASCFNFHCLINTKLYFQVLYDIWNRQSYLETSKGKLSSTATSKSSLSILVNSSISEKFPLNAGELYSLYRTVKAWSLLLFHSVMELRMCHPPTKELMKLTLEQKLSHNGHPVLLSTMTEKSFLFEYSAILTYYVLNL